ncbi:hypothetical protein B0J11DRAFT_13764 [Dendryphion nanum]|uniref:Rhodopsin domain-containing protein n=1 Tax=Dendryphion nanum TaxID=256645 RepID=A0A9P9EJ10_9PLEO|nr:hypothetical protein B0J11DRAFT_13764 [Dendryphion nanum]
MIILERRGHAFVTNDDRGAMLAVITWLLACAVVICTAIRLATRFTDQHFAKLDNVITLIAAGLAVGGIIATSIAVSSGLGKRSYLLKPGDLPIIEKGLYASTLLYVLTLGISKISILLFLRKLFHTKAHKLATTLLNSIVICWTVAITISVAFECSLPTPWERFSAKCVPMKPFWISATAIDIATDLALILLPIFIVSTLQIELRKKMIIIAIFASRLILVTLSTLRIIYLTRSAFPHTLDPAFTVIPCVITTQCHASLAVILSCTLALKPLITNIQSGMLSIALPESNPGSRFSQDTYNKQVSARPSTSTQKGKSIEKQLPPPPSIIYCPPADQPVRSNIPPLPRTPPKTAIRGISRSPPRPPSPPEDLRPSLSLYVTVAKAECMQQRIYQSVAQKEASRKPTPTDDIYRRGRRNAIRAVQK